MYKVRVIKIKITRWLLARHELPLNDLLRLCERGKIHLRMHAGKLSYGILEPLAISINDIVVEFLFYLLEELDLLNQLPLHLPQLNFALGGPLLQLGHLGRHPLYLFL